MMCQLIASLIWAFYFNRHDGNNQMIIRNWCNSSLVKRELVADNFKEKGTFSLGNSQLGILETNQIFQVMLLILLSLYFLSLDLNSYQTTTDLTLHDWSQ